jgi:hypothetical protein
MKTVIFYGGVRREIRPDAQLLEGWGERERGREGGRERENLFYFI